MNRILIISLIALSVSFEVLANTCKTCNGHGRKKLTFTCEYCEGAGVLLPERLGLESGCIKYTETTYYNGRRTYDNIRQKKYSKQRCPGCAVSSTKAGTCYREVTCKECNGLGIIEPYSTIDVPTMRSACDLHSKIYGKQLAKNKKISKKYLETDKESASWSNINKFFEKDIKTLKEIRAKLTAGIANKDIASISENKGKLEEISKRLDDILLMDRHYEISKKYPALETAEESKKSSSYN